MRPNSSAFVSRIVIAAACSLLATALSQADVPLTGTIDPTAGRIAISPYIYGTNQDIAGTPFTSFRYGGNRTTGYNWENNASNAGSDYLHSSDDFATWFVGITGAQASVPGIAVTHFHDQALARAGAPYSIVTLQLGGYVAKDKLGPVAVSEAAPSARWVPVSFTKGTAFSLTPDLNDGAVYLDEFVNFLVNRYGAAGSARGVRGYALDNEPDLWSNTHPRIHPAQPTGSELVSRNIEAAKAVKRVDPAAEVFGFVSYGFGGYNDFQGAPDWAALKAGKPYRWFIDYYLDQMKKAADTAGFRLIDVLDLHNYSEHTAGGERVNDSQNWANIDCNKGRMQAPRSLWDSTFVENSWIAQYFARFLPFIPNIKESIAAYYPGTKLAFTEYNFGGESHISGGIAQADALGIFARQGVYVANWWQLHDNPTYTAAAFKLFQNYDGNGGTIGTTLVASTLSDVANGSLYAAVDPVGESKLHVIILNKNYDQSAAISVQIAGTKLWTQARVFAFDAASPVITERTAINNIAGNRLVYTLPPLTAAHFVVVAAAVPPAITTQPVSQQVKIGASVTLSVVATGSPAPAYQWQRNGVDVAGATGATLTIASAAPANAGDYTVVVTNAAGAITSAIAVLRVGGGEADFNADGKPDLLWQNSITGERAIWLMNGTNFIAASTLGIFPLEWTIAATGDFNADGKTDLIWSNSLTGERALWLMNGTALLGVSTLGIFPLEWTVAATADFNADGKPDIIWSNSITGERAIWLMNGTNFLSASTLGTFPLEWTVAATGDFNADGKPDIIWSNSMTGERAIWLMNGTNFLGASTLGVFPLEWTVRGTADFNADGKPDIIWSNRITGERALWLMNGTNFLGASTLGIFPLEWTVIN